MGIPNPNPNIEDGKFCDNKTLSSNKIKELVDGATELPEIGLSDEGKVLGVEDGEYKLISQGGGASYNETDLYAYGVDKDGVLRDDYDKYDLIVFHVLRNNNDHLFHIIKPNLINTNQTMLFPAYGSEYTTITLLTKSTYSKVHNGFNGEIMKIIGINY